MAGVWLRCGDCGTLLKSVEEAENHAKLTRRTNFSESSELLHLVCSVYGKTSHSKTESDLHTKRTGRGVRRQDLGGNNTLWPHVVGKNCSQGKEFEN